MAAVTGQVPAVAGTAGASPRPVLHADVTVERRDLTVTADLTVPGGDLLALVGPSGAGKSTVLAAVAGLVALRRGAVRLGDEVLATGAAGRRHAGRGVALHHRGVGLLAQRPGLFPHLDAAANIGYALPGGARHPRVRELAEQLGVADVLAARPDRLSGGQRQRVALARVLAAEPRILLLDEPFTGLDAALHLGVGAVVAGEVRRRRVPTVLVTHGLADAQRWADRVVVVDRGRCLQVGDPAALVREPATARVAALVGYRAFVPTEAVVAAGGAAARVPRGAATLGIHPACLVVGDGAGMPAPAEGGAVGHPGRARAVTAWLQGTVTALRAVGAGTEADVVLPGGAVVPVALGPAATAPMPGQPCAVTVVGAPWFDAAGCLLQVGPPGVAAGLAEPPGVAAGPPDSSGLAAGPGDRP